jgi:hypothetical protein
MNRKNGFTVAEILLVLLLLVAVGAVLVVPVQHLAGQLAVRPLETVVLAAVRDAHYLARSRNESIFLVNVSESNVLRIAAQDGLVLADIAYASADGERATGIRFHRVLPEDPDRTGEDFTLDEQPVETILFNPCGVSVPFAIHLAEGGTPRLLVMDPFSSDVLRREEAL